MRGSTIIAITVVVSLGAALANPAGITDEFNRKGIEFFDAARYAEAEAEHRKAIDFYRAKGPEFIHYYAVSLNNLSAALQSQGKTAEARKLMEETISLADKMGPFTDPVLTHALNNLALLHHLESNLNPALTLLKRALKVTTAEGVTRAGTLHNLGAVYFDMGKIREAEQLFEQALAMNLKSGGRDSLPPTYTYLARLAGIRGDTTRAEFLMQKGLEVRRELSPEHPTLAVTLGDLGELYKDKKQYDKAIDHFTRALDIFDSKLGKDHVYSAPILFQYGETLRMQKKFEEALPYFERTIAILVAAFGPEHARLATVYTSAAEVNAKLKNKTTAKLYRQQAAAIEGRRVDSSKHTIDVNAFLPSR